MHEKTDFSETPLFVEIKKISDDDYDVTNIITLIARSPDCVQAKGNYDETYLHVLLTPTVRDNGAKRVVSLCYLLVEAGVDVNSSDCQGNTPLHVAVINELPRCIVCALLRLGAYYYG